MSLFSGVLATNSQPVGVPLIFCSRVLMLDTDGARRALNWRNFIGAQIEKTAFILSVFNPAAMSASPPPVENPPMTMLSV